jgi:hypothetical protein
VPDRRWSAAVNKDAVAQAYLLDMRWQTLIPAAALVSLNDDIQLMCRLNCHHSACSRLASTAGMRLVIDAGPGTIQVSPSH